MSFLMVRPVGVHARVGRIKEECDKKSHPLDFIAEDALTEQDVLEDSFYTWQTS